MYYSMKKINSTSGFRSILTLTLVWIFSHGLLAQNMVRGTVTSEKDQLPLIGVNVLVKGTINGTSTDLEGNYSLIVEDPDNAILVFSYIGYMQKEIPLEGRTTLSLSLSEDFAELDEVIVVGYGTMKKSDLTGAIISMKEEQMHEVKTGNVLESLQGKAAGVDIRRDNGRAGAGVSITVRGNRSLTASNSPLVIVDGVPYGDNIEINPNDIESIEILKDVSSTAIYGSRGANGVILITTKKGSAQRTKIFVNSYYGITQPFQKVPVFDREGYITAKIDANRDIYNWDTIPNPINVFPGDEFTGYENGTETDWQDIVTQNGVRQDHHVGFSGGSDKMIYSTSFNYFSEEGVVLADRFDRYTLRTNLEGELNKYLTIGGSTILTFSERDGRGPRFTDAVRLSPIVPAYDSLGNYIYQPNFANPRKSPLAYVEDVDEERTTRVFSMVYAQLRILDNMNFKSNFGLDLRSRRSGYMYPQKEPTQGFTTSGANLGFDYSYTWTNLLNYFTEFGRSSLTLTLGQEARYGRHERYNLDGELQDADRSLWYNLTTNKNQQTSSSLVESSMLSFFGRANYNYDNRYLFNFTGRYDGASQLAEGNKWDFFPSAGAAWRITGEEFMDNIEVISDMKIRAGIGVSGNASVSPYGTAASANRHPLFIQFGDPGQEVFYSGYRPVSLASKTLKWETTTSINLGLDLGFFKNRVVANVDLFRAHTENLLLSDKLPLSSGFFSIMTNAGETITEGIELNIFSVNVHGSNFKWTSNLTFSSTREEILSLNSGVLQDIANGWFVGEPLRVYYDFEKEGIWQMDEEEEAAAAGSFPGHIKVADLDGNDTINFDDRKILGQKNPKWFGSFVNTFTYKGFDLTVNLYARMGHMIDASAYTFDPRMYDNQLAISYWTPENPTNEYPRLNASLTEMDYEHLLRYRDGSFIKIKNITLGYTLPESWVTKAHISSVRVYFSTNNPFILYSTLYEGIDPETGGGYSWPLARTMVFGINLEF